MRRPEATLTILKGVTTGVCAAPPSGSTIWAHAAHVSGEQHVLHLSFEALASTERHDMWRRAMALFTAASSAPPAQKQASGNASSPVATSCSGRILLPGIRNRMWQRGDDALKTHARVETGWRRQPGSLKQPPQKARNSLHVVNDYRKCVSLRFQHKNTFGRTLEAAAPPLHQMAPTSLSTK